MSQQSLGPPLRGVLRPPVTDGMLSCSRMEDTQLRRLPPDGHEFPPSYTELAPPPPEPITEVEKPPPPLPVTEPPPILKPGVRIPNWRKDEKSECSVKDKIAMFSSAVTKMDRSPSFKTTTMERTQSSLSVSSAMEQNHSSLNLFPLTDGKSTNLDRTHSSLDLSYSPGQYCSTLPRKPVMSSSTESAPRLTRATSFSGGSLHTRSQSLIDIGRGTMEDIRKASLNALIEQRRRGISKLRGLVIPEKVSEITAPSPSICDLPEIRSKDSIFSKTISTPIGKYNYLKPTSAPVAANRWSTPSATTNTSSTMSNPVPPVVIPSPPWKTSNSSSNLPKYSPAFKRKSLTVYGSSSSSFRDEPPASLESITSPARSDLSFDYKLPVTEKNMSPSGRHLSTEDESDTDSAVSSSRSSISPPPTPPPPSLLSPLHRTLSSETTASASSSTASTITCGSSDSNRRVLKAQSVEAINRKNVLSSARYSSGRDVKVGSPLIQRKFDEEERRVAYVTDVEEPGLTPAPVKPLPAPRRVPVPPKPVQRKSMEVNPEEEADLLSVLMGGRMRRQRSKDNILSDDKRSASVHDIRKTFEMAGRKVNHARVSSLDSTASEDSFTPQYGSVGNLHREQFGSVTSIASSTSLISPQELQVLIDEANQPLDDCDVVVVVLHREGSTGSAPRSEVVLVVSRSRGPQEPNHEDEFSVMTTHVPRPSRPPRIPEQPVETVSVLSGDDRGPPVTVTLTKDGAGLGFSLEGGKDSPLGDKPLTIKKIFTGGSAEKNGQLIAGDELLNVNGTDVTLLSRIEAWGLMKRLPDGPVALTVRHRLNK
ncbi:hypothetical protein C0J52_14010 [Blattella germanica]|nr:hypothetical protein C0J52_14010 [Blattella germanica]